MSRPQPLVRIGVDRHFQCCGLVFTGPAGGLNTYSHGDIQVNQGQSGWWIAQVRVPHGTIEVQHQSLGNALSTLAGNIVEAHKAAAIIRNASQFGWTSDPAPCTKEQALAHANSAVRYAELQLDAAKSLLSAAERMP